MHTAYLRQCILVQKCEACVALQSVSWILSETCEECSMSGGDQFPAGLSDTCERQLSALSESGDQAVGHSRTLRSRLTPSRVAA